MWDIKVNRNNFIKALSAAITNLAITQIVYSAGDFITSDKALPNFIIIFTDDQGYGDLGVFGANDIATPNIDEMAREGVTFINRIFNCLDVA